MPLLSLLGDPTTYQGLQTDTFIDYAARELHRKTLRYELAIFKYGTLPEPTIKQIFKKAEIISRGHASPGIYLELDQSTRGLFTEDGRVPFYRALVGRFIDALEQTRFGETDEARRLRELYETSFDEIYNTEEIGYRPDGNYLPDPLLKQFFNIGMNLSTLNQHFHSSKFP